MSPVAVLTSTDDLCSPGPLVPAYTINFFRKKLYIINSERLIPTVHRHSKTLSFNPMVKTMAQSFSGFQAHELAIFDKDVSRTQHLEGLSSATLRSFHAAFSPGAGSEDLQISMLNHLQRLLGELDNRDMHTLDLYAWVKHTVTQASMRAVYGPGNPFTDQNVENAFWQVISRGSCLT